MCTSWWPRHADRINIKIAPQRPGHRTGYGKVAPRGRQDKQVIRARSLHPQDPFASSFNRSGVPEVRLLIVLVSGFGSSVCLVSAGGRLAPADVSGCHRFRSSPSNPQARSPRVPPRDLRPTGCSSAALTTSNETKKSQLTGMKKSLRSHSKLTLNAGGKPATSSLARIRIRCQRRGLLSARSATLAPRQLPFPSFRWVTILFS
jgi:hypothetical protein